MNQRPVNQPHRRMTRAEVRRRRRSRAIRRVAGLTAAVCLFVGGAAVAVGALIIAWHGLLYIIDLAAGSQPMEDAITDRWCVNAWLTLDIAAETQNPVDGYA